MEMEYNDREEEARYLRWAEWQDARFAEEIARNLRHILEFIEGTVRWDREALLYLYDLIVYAAVNEAG